MGVNEEILNNWNNQISNYGKLQLKEAKELYKSFREDKIKLNNIILQTLYVVVSFIEKSGLLYLNNSSYDMNDIINSCNKIWVEKINRGDLLKVNYYNEMFDSEFYNLLSNDLGIQNIDIKNISVLNLSSFSSFFINYVKYKMANGDFNYLDFLEYLYKNEEIQKHYYNYVDYDYLKRHNDFIEIFDAIIDSFEDKKDLINLTKSKVDKIKNILLSNALAYLKKDINEVLTDNIFEDIDKKISVDAVINIILETEELNDKEKKTLISRFGLLNERVLTLGQIGEKINVSRERARQIEAKAIRKCRRMNCFKGGFYE